MTSIKPCKLLLWFAFAVFSASIFSVLSTGLGLIIKLILIFGLIFYFGFESLKILQQMPYSLCAFFMPDKEHSPWQLIFKNGYQSDAKLLGSTRVTGKIIILHFRLLHRKIRTYQVIFPAMIGSKKYHDLLVYLKTN